MPMSVLRPGRIDLFEIRAVRKFDDTSFQVMVAEAKGGVCLKVGLQGHAQSYAPMLVTCLGRRARPDVPPQGREQGGHGVLAPGAAAVRHGAAGESSQARGRAGERGWGADAALLPSLAPQNYDRWKAVYEASRQAKS